MKDPQLRPDDQEAVVKAVGHLAPSIVVESIHDGFYKYKRSRAKDPDAYLELTDCTRANLLYDRIASSARNLIDALSSPDVQYQITKNRRSTEILLDTRFAFRIKRSKRNRNNLTTGVRTNRQCWIKPDNAMLSIGQLVLPFPSNQVVVSDRERLWLTVAFDLDEVEESVTQIVIGRELKNKFEWKRPLEAPSDEVLASLPGPVADAIEEMRQERSA